MQFDVDIIVYEYWKVDAERKTIIFNVLLNSKKITGARSTDHPSFPTFLFFNLFSIKFLYFFIISSLFQNRGKKMHLLGMDTCPSLNNIMEIRCNKCTRREQGYDFERVRKVSKI
jgi:hypothetical protein